MIAASGTDGNVDVAYAITVLNDGTEDVDSLTLIDDLDDQFGTAFVGIVTVPSILGDLTPARANTAYDLSLIHI